MTALDPSAHQPFGATMSGVEAAERIWQRYVQANRAVWDWLAYDLLPRVPGHARFVAAVEALDDRLSEPRRRRIREENRILAGKLRAAGAPGLAEQLEQL